MITKEIFLQAIETAHDYENGKSECRFEKAAMGLSKEIREIHRHAISVSVAHTEMGELIGLLTSLLPLLQDDNNSGIGNLIYDTNLFCIVEGIHIGYRIAELEREKETKTKCPENV